MAYGDPKVVVDVKDTEHGEILYTETDGQKHTYYPTHSIWLEVETLKVLTTLGAPQEEGEAPPLITRVVGTATLEDYSISVVGDPKSKVRTLTISFEADDWRPSYVKVESEVFPSKPDVLGGAMLGFNRADWEIGNADDWWIACHLPKSFIDSLVASVQAGTLQDLRLSLTLQGLYTTEHSMAPVSSRGHLFIRPNKLDNSIEFPDMATGYVRAIHFSSPKLDLRKPVPLVPEESFLDDPVLNATESENSVFVAVEMLDARLEKLRMTVKWLGGLIVVALLFIAFK